MLLYNYFQSSNRTTISPEAVMYVLATLQIHNTKKFYNLFTYDTLHDAVWYNCIKRKQPLTLIVVCSAANSRCALLGVCSRARILNSSSDVIPSLIVFLGNK